MSWGKKAEKGGANPPRPTRGGKSPRVVKLMEAENRKRRREEEEKEVSEEGGESSDSRKERRTKRREDMGNALGDGREDLPPQAKQRRLVRADGSSVRGLPEDAARSGEVAPREPTPPPAKRCGKEVASGGGEDEPRKGPPSSIPSESGEAAASRRVSVSGTRSVTAEETFACFEDSANPDHFGFRYRGDGPIVQDPAACAAWIKRFPEMADASPEELEDPRRARQDVAAAHLWLLSMGNRLERAHRSREEALEKEVKALQEAVQSRDEEKMTLISDLELEQKKLQAKDGELAVHEAEIGVLKGEVEQLRAQLEASDRECGLRDAELDLRKRELAEKTEEVGRMGGVCRTWVRRLLRRQRRAHNRCCRERNRDARGTLRRYLRSRRDFDVVDKFLSQAEGTRDILGALLENGVPIPAAVIAEVEAKVVKYAAEKAAFDPVEISPEDFCFELPDGLGVPDVEKIDFRVGVPAGEGSSSEEGNEVSEEEESSEEGEEDEEEDGEEGESSEEGSRGGKTGKLPEGETAVQPGVSGPGSSQPEVSEGATVEVAGDPPAQAPGNEGEEGRVELEGDVTPPARD